MYKDVREFVQTCLFFQQSSSSYRGRVNINPYFSNDKEYSCDLSFFNGWILFHLMNMVTRVVLRKCITDKSSKAVAEAMKEAIKFFKTKIQRVLTDCGTESAEHMKNF